jgi:hypothetical protein
MAIMPTLVGGRWRREAAIKVYERTLPKISM